MPPAKSSERFFGFEFLAGNQPPSIHVNAVGRVMIHKNPLSGNQATEQPENP